MKNEIIKLNNKRFLDFKLTMIILILLSVIFWIWFFSSLVLYIGGGDYVDDFNIVFNIVVNNWIITLIVTLLPVILLCWNMLEFNKGSKK